MTSPAIGPMSDALEAVYREFALPRPPVIAGCPCCISTRGCDVLLSTSLRQISGQQLWRYVSGAFLTVGDEADFRYLLPRILDISVNDPANANDPQIVIGKLGLANLRNWTTAEQQVIEEFLDAWFDRALARDLAEADQDWIGTEAESVLCGVAIAGLPLHRLLGRLQDPHAAPVLADLKKRFPRQLSEFWKDAPNGFTELSAILAQDQL
ncbi:hypothetical protein FSZ31_11140 [Sphingorhabdus soli]|uniref:Uncharacterized protein n=1 Tax=Flavisphingopyxis soli TaxID=2601267 RepID=A0A5C6U9D4_9SPHN|nr:hypothetical protein [Sphingorhabdus soli]TXC68235.1 hypothetical protein FSZ31_11140 [Sphingorhabdus soli]